MRSLHLCVAFECYGNPRWTPEPQYCWGTQDEYVCIVALGGVYEVDQQYVCV